MGRRLAAAPWLAALVLCGACAGALAQGWKPERPVEMIIGTSPGGPQDRTGRVVQRIIQDHRLVPATVNIVNRPGGGGALGLNLLNTHPGDGHYLMVNSITLLTNYISGKSPLNYTDFTPLAIMGIEYVVLAVRADSPIRTGREFVERLRRDPASASLSIGTALGNATHISLVLAMKAAGVDVRRLKAVAFASSSEGVTALLGGHVDATAGAVSTLYPQVKAGKARLLAIAAPQRLTGELASVPTWKELGYDSAFDLWRGFAGPRGLTPAQVAFWDGVLSRVAASEEWKKELEQHMMANVYKGSAETLRHWRAEFDEVKAVFTELGLAAR